MRPSLNANRREWINPIWVRLLVVTVLCISPVRAQFYNAGAIGTGYSNPGIPGSSIYQPRYNLEWGPIDYSFNAGLTASYSDNINYAQFNRQSDFILAPIVGVDARWDISDDNTLNFNGGVGYQFYTEHPQDDSMIITPNTKLSYNFLVGENFHFNAHEAFQYTQNPSLVPQVSNTVNFPVALNDAGLSMSYSGFDIFTPGIDYDHINQFVFDNSYKYLDYTTDQISPHVSYQLLPTMAVGIQAVSAYTQYDESIQSNYFTLNVGPYFSGNVTDDISIAANVGYIVTEYQNNQSSFEDNQSSGNNSYYTTLGVTYILNPYWTVSGVGGHDYLAGLTTNYTERYYGQFGVTWQATTDLQINTHVLGEKLRDSPGAISETDNRFETGVNVNYNLGQHVTLEGSYEYTLKDSNLFGQSYKQDTLSVGLQYQF